MTVGTGSTVPANSLLILRTFGLESKFPAGHSGINVIKEVVTDSAPALVQTHLQGALVLCLPTEETEVSIVAKRSCMVGNKNLMCIG